MELDSRLLLSVGHFEAQQVPGPFLAVVSVRAADARLTLRVGEKRMPAPAIVLGTDKEEVPKAVPNADEAHRTSEEVEGIFRPFSTFDIRSDLERTLQISWNSNV